MTSAAGKIFGGIGAACAVGFAVVVLVNADKTERARLEAQRQAAVMREIESLASLCEAYRTWQFAVLKHGVPASHVTAAPYLDENCPRIEAQKGEMK